MDISFRMGDERRACASRVLQRRCTGCLSQLVVATLSLRMAEFQTHPLFKFAEPLSSHHHMETMIRLLKVSRRQNEHISEDHWQRVCDQRRDFGINRLP